MRGKHVTCKYKLHHTSGLIQLQGVGAVQISNNTTRSVKKQPQQSPQKRSVPVRAQAVFVLPPMIDQELWLRCMGVVPSRRSDPVTGDGSVARRRGPMGRRRFVARRGDCIHRNSSHDRGSAKGALRDLGSRGRRPLNGLERRAAEALRAYPQR